MEELHEKVKVLLEDHPDLLKAHLKSWEGVEEEDEKLNEYSAELVRKKYAARGEQYMPSTPRRSAEESGYATGPRM